VNVYGIAHSLTSGALGEFVDVLRSPATVGPTGRVRGQQVPVFTYSDVWAIVTPLGPDNLIRQPEYETMQNTIEVATDFPLQGPSTDVLADKVVWHGRAYVVTNLREYSRFGLGYIDAICQIVVLPTPAQVDSGAPTDSLLGPPNPP
jgi:hypothetical protein